MKQTNLRSRLAWLCPVALVVFAACDGSSNTASRISTDAGKPQLLQIEYGRLVDIYSYQMVNQTNGDRRDRFNRRLQLYARDVVINPNIETQALFDAAGAVNPDANYEFRPFDKRVGHEELVILWDSSADTEAQQFQDALARAQQGLPELAPAFRNQNTSTRPIPVAPRDGALRLTFSAPLQVDASFFRINPAAVQLLEFKGDPDVVPPFDAFRAVPFRVIVSGSTLVIDPTILGGENTAGFGSTGLPPSVDLVTANIRLAIPTRGGVSSAFYVRDDPVAQLNGTDGFGRTSLIRDFRSGNLRDGSAGTLRDPEPPMILGSLGMGITAVDAATGTITLNKRLRRVPVRARYPFVEGPLSPAMLPLGPALVPTLLPLRSGDFLTQVVNVTLPNGGVEAVRVRAEILQNLEIGTVVGDPVRPLLGRTAAGTQGDELLSIRVKVASVFAGTDSAGQPVSFQANAEPTGADCTLQAYYYEEVRFVDGSGAVSDTANRSEFLRIDPQPPTSIGGVPVPPGTRVSPQASVAIEFSKPMDLERLDATTNLVLTNEGIPGTSFIAAMADPKLATAGVVPVRQSDQGGDSTVIQLQPQAGLFHRRNTPEAYWFHLMLGASGVTDLAGNPVAIFDDTRNPVANWSVTFALDQDAADNMVGWHVYRFESVDEDGTLPGSVDIYGQFRILDGVLTAADTVRFSRTADNQNLGGISRINRGECWNAVGATPGLVVPQNPQNGGNLYWQPRMVDVNPTPPAVFLPPNTPQPVGRVIEPHQPRGSRMMMRYLEDDFSLDYRNASLFALDVEQLYWSPFSDENVLFDVFDRYTMALSHCDKRPDEQFVLIPGAAGPPVVPPVCQFVCASVSSSLSAEFDDNLLRGSRPTTVFADKVYRINPNEAFRSPANVKYVPYPRFDRSYTWRDSRLVTIDSLGQVIGLGGARDPGQDNVTTNPTLNQDRTTNIDSPWITSVPPASFTGPIYVLDEADFRGARRRDHDPIALPLLVDFKMFPDSAANGVARGVNAFQVAMLGPPSAFPIGNPGGYYNSVGVGCAGRNPWAWVRIHSTGGIDPNTGNDILVDPANMPFAQGGFLKDAGLGDPIQGIFQAPAGDGMLHWAQADFVRRVSTMTFGFLDTLQPQRRAEITGATITNRPGFPDFAAINTNLRISDLVTQMDPPLSRQPAGTSVVLEFRAAADFANSGVLYNPTYAQNGATANDTFNGRGNLLNPNYACEAYRYSTPNSGATFDLPRVAASGLTPYVTEDRINQLRDPANGLLPRFLNLRIVMTNNVDVTPAISPGLKSLSLIYRMQPIQ